MTFDVKTLEGLRNERGSDEGKVFNLVRGLLEEVEEHPEQAAVLASLDDSRGPRAERHDGWLHERSGRDGRIGGASPKRRKRRNESLAESGLLASRPSEYFLALRDRRRALQQRESIRWRSPAKLQSATGAATRMQRSMPDEQRLLRTGLYDPLLALSPDDLKRVVERAMSALRLG